MAALIAALSGCSAPPARTAADAFPRGAVAADHHAASEAGAEILRAGGNAVDAAVATSFALSVVRPYSCGIGGGGFMVIHFSDEGQRPRGSANPSQQSSTRIALDYRETAPAAITPDFFETLAQRPSGSPSTTGGRAVATPGTVAGLLYALETYGTFPRSRILAPAIRLAEQGFIVDAHYIDSIQPLIRRFTDTDTGPELQQRFSFLWDRFLRRGEIAIGDRITLPEQAAALRLIARDGAAAFYEGPIADAIIRAIQNDGGVMTSDDLGSYWVRERAPITFTFAGRTFLTMPPPSSGGIAMAQALGIVQIIDRSVATDAGIGLHSAIGTPGFSHLLIEAFKHAFADRAEWLADPDFVDVPHKRLLSSDYLRRRAATFDPSRTLEPAAYGTRDTESLSSLPDNSGTSHFSIVDRWGNAVACTETINLTFGSLLAVNEFGFILNNEMDDFTTRRGQPNAFGLRQSDRNLPQPRKRPLSSMTPTIVLDPQGRVEIVAGGAGGPRIITATAQAILYALAGMTASEAAAAPRLHHQWAPDLLQLERAFPAELAENLAARGHQTRPATALANVQIIVRDRFGWTAAADPRKGGRPAGH